MWLDEGPERLVYETAYRRQRFFSEVPLTMMPYADRDRHSPSAMAAKTAKRLFAVRSRDSRGSSRPGGRFHAIVLASVSMSP